jgi:hypothetical protein
MSEPWGPIILVFDVVPENRLWGVVLSLLLFPHLLIVFVRPRWWSVLLFILAAPTWIWLGILAKAIHC